MTAREEGIEAAARAIFSEEGPECIDDDGADGLARIALAAALPVLLNDLAERIEAEMAAAKVSDESAFRIAGLHRAAEIVRDAAEGWTA